MITKNKSRKYVNINCYGNTHLMSREKAIETYTSYIFASEGSERDRYVSILQQLNEGLNFCTDEL